MRAFSGRTPSIRIMASAVSDKRLDAAQTEITQLMTQRHQIPTGQDPDFQVRNMADLASAAQASSKVFTLLLASIASVSLLVGGIGIMNIMLVSVTERTREIGIRMAVGAKGNDVLMQFLVEAVVISLLGGIIGILFGWAPRSSSACWPSGRFHSCPVPSSCVLLFRYLGIFFGSTRAAGVPT